jgi:hypothetical protein
MTQEKLYTEEQMAKVWMAGQKYWETSGASITFEELLEHEKPIELPSDEDIKEYLQKRHTKAVNPPNVYYRTGFESGAKWMKEQILNQNK